MAKRESSRSRRIVAERTSNHTPVETDSRRGMPLGVPFAHCEHSHVGILCAAMYLRILLYKGRQELPSSDKTTLKWKSYKQVVVIRHLVYLKN